MFNCGFALRWDRHPGVRSLVESTYHRERNLNTTAKYSTEENILICQPEVSLCTQKSEPLIDY